MGLFDTAPAGRIADFSQLGALSKIGLILQNVADPSTLVKYQQSLQDQSQADFLNQQRQIQIEQLQRDQATQQRLEGVVSDPAFAGLSPNDKWQRLIAANPVAAIPSMLESYSPEGQAALRASQAKAAREAAVQSALANFANGGQVKPMSAPQSPVFNPSAAPLSVRNNNPGNLRDASTGAFRTFDTPDAGLQALNNDITAKVGGTSNAMKAAYGDGYTPTINSVLAVYAPKSENDTAAYARHVSKESGIPVDQPLTVADVPRILPAIVQMEGGTSALAAYGPKLASTSESTMTMVDNGAYAQQSALNTYQPTEPDYAGLGRALIGAGEVSQGSALLALAQQQQDNASAATKAAKEDQSDLVAGEGELRKQFEGLPDVKQFREVENAYGRIAKSVENPSAAGDIALIFNYMKMLDPGSTVREGEFATAQNAGGIPDIIRAQFNKLQNGERLTPEQRNDFLSQASRQYIGAEDLFNSRATQYEELASAYEYKPNRIVQRARQNVALPVDKPVAVENASGWSVTKLPARK